MANLTQVLSTYNNLKHIIEPYILKARYKNKDFVRKELLRVLLESVKQYFENGETRPIGLHVRLAITRRMKCFGIIEKWYMRNLYIPKQYVGKLGGYEKLSWERSDVLQELNIKMLMTIKAWGRRYREFQHTGRYKPVPVDIFIRTAMNNRLKDFFKYVERVPKTQSVTYASEGGSRFDIISHSNELGETVIDLPGKRLLICGEDVLQGLGTKREKAIFMLNFMGFKPQELDRKFSKPGFCPSAIVATHQARLMNNAGLRRLLSERIQETVS